MKGHNYGRIPCRKCGKVHVHPMGTLGMKFPYKPRPSMKGDTNPSKRPEVREKIREARFRWNPMSNLESRKQVSVSRKKNWENPVYRKHMSDAHIGQTPRNKGLGTPNLYGYEFTEELKEKVRETQRRKCASCGLLGCENQGKLDVHHIDGNKANNEITNLTALCDSCHSKITNQQIKEVTECFG